MAYFGGSFARSARGLTGCVLAFGVTAPTAVAAMDACQIVSDIAVYEARAEQAIVLMQYEDIVVRATGGKIRCEKDAANARQICQVEGPGEMLIDAPKGLFVVDVPAKDPHVVQIYATGDLSCARAVE